MSTDLLRSLDALVDALDADHACVAAALAGRPSATPHDPVLADLHRALVVLRALDPEASALHLLGAAAESSGEAVQQHLMWLDARAEGAVVVLPPTVVIDLSVAC